MTLVCVISSLGPGGGERVLCTAANWWARQGKEVHIVVLSEATESHFPLDRSVRLHFLGMAGTSGSFMHAICQNFKRIRVIRQILKALSPKIVVSFMDSTNVLTLMATLGTGVHVVATEHTSPHHYHPGMIWAALRRVVYPLAGAIIVQSEEAKNYYSSRIQRQITVLPNPIEIFEKNEPLDKLSKRILVGMGRLSPEKGFDLLIDAFASVAEDFPEWTLVVLGEGDSRQILELQVANLGISDRVLLPGFVYNPHDWFRQADLFVLSSLFEGFSNVLVEAMMCGLPVVSSNCPWGPRHILGDSVGGLLVEAGEIDSLAEGLAKVMGDPALRESMAVQAMEESRRYEVDKVMKQWEAVVIQPALPFGHNN